MWYAVVFVAGLILGHMYGDPMKRVLIDILEVVVEWIVDALWTVVEVVARAIVLLWLIFSGWLASLWYWFCQRFDTLRKKLIVLLVVLFWIVLAVLGITYLISIGAGVLAIFFIGLMFVSALVVFLLSSDFAQWVIAMVLAAVIAIGVFWGAVIELLGELAELMSALFSAIGLFFAKVLAGAATVLGALVSVIPSCGGAPETTVATPVAQKKAQVADLPALEYNLIVLQTVIARSGDGCIRMTGLSLEACNRLAAWAGRPVKTRGGYIMAPEVRLGEVWRLVQRSNGTTYWLVPSASELKK